MSADNQEDRRESCDLSTDPARVFRNAEAPSPARRRREPTSVASRVENLQVAYHPLSGLTPYARNSRTHSDEQVAQIAASIKEFGFTNPVLIDDEGGIIAGHGRVLAAQRLKLETVPTICLSGLSETQRRAYVIADNRLALNAGWDVTMLGVELDALREVDFDISLLGFGDDEIDDLIKKSAAADEALASEYTQKLSIPVYEPKGDKPPVAALADEAKARELIARIMASSASDEDKAFLILAAGRHVVFDYQQIAEFYCHASEEVQELMEASALVLIDFDKAVAEGYVQMSKKLEGVYSDTHGDGDGDAD